MARGVLSDLVSMQAKALATQMSSDERLLLRAFAEGRLRLRGMKLEELAP